MRVGMHRHGAGIPHGLWAGVVMHVGMHRHGAGIHLDLSVRSGSVAPPSHQLAGWHPPVGGKLDKIVLPHGAVSTGENRCASEGRGGCILRL